MFKDNADTMFRLASRAAVVYSVHEHVSVFYLATIDLVWILFC
jgi:hypothetical protein